MLQLIFSVSTLWWLMLFLYIPACFGLIIIVLLQKGKGQGLAGAFGMGGGMDTIFGPRSSKSLPQKITYASAGVFMTLALVMSILSGRVGRASAPELAVDAPQASFDALFEAAEEGEAAVIEGTVTPGEEAPATPAFTTVDVSETAPSGLTVGEPDAAAPTETIADEAAVDAPGEVVVSEEPAGDSDDEVAVETETDAEPPQAPITIIDMGAESTPEAPAE